MHTQQLVSQCQLTFSQPGEPQVLQSRSTTVELLSPLCWHLPGRVSLMLLSSLHRSLSTLGVSLSRALSTLGVSPQRSASCWCLCLFPSFTRSTTQYSLSILPLSHAPSVPSTLFPSLSFPLMLPLSRSLSCSLFLVPSHAPSLPSSPPFPSLRTGSRAAIISPVLLPSLPPSGIHHRPTSRAQDFSGTEIEESCVCVFVQLLQN